MRWLLGLTLAACGSKTVDPVQTPAQAAAGCEGFCAKGKACAPEAIEPTQCVQACAENIVEACRTCVVQTSCAGIQAGDCDTACR